MIQDRTVKTAIIMGTRPEIIKMSPVIRALIKHSNDYFIIHTGQHYSYNMDKVFFEQLQLPDAKYKLEVGSGTHAEQTARILIGVEKTLIEEKPTVVLVEGDTNTVLAGALASAKLAVCVGHVEAGLRSYDRLMPEEINRILVDHCSEYLFAPTEKAAKILLGEGVPREKIFVTGNTIVDAIYQSSSLGFNYGNVLNKLNLKPKGYFLVTIHRQENVDNSNRFAGILDSLRALNKKYHLPAIYPIHPRSHKMMLEFNLNRDNITMIDPLDYFGFLQLERNAKLILTDSGGVQEESCILGVPCVTLRDSTERPETLEVGANILAGVVPKNIIDCAGIMLTKNDGWPNPFGDGKAGERITIILNGEQNG